jgi:hypothetical protein
MLLTFYNVTKLENPNQTSSPFKANLGELENTLLWMPRITLSLYKTANPKSQTKKGHSFQKIIKEVLDVDYVIVTPVSLVTQAEKLADFHRPIQSLTQSNHRIYLSRIFLGKQDIAAYKKLH